MSSSPERRVRSARAHRDEGFSLIEIIVSIGVLTVVMVAVLPLLIIGIRSTGTAAMITQGKGIAQGQLEQMRNLPYYVAPSRGEYRDVLDYYFRDRVAGVAPVCRAGDEYASPNADWSGYVSESTPRCDYEPTGAGYRKVLTAPNAPEFTIVVNTQFLAGSTTSAPVAPPTAYNTQDGVQPANSRPASSQIGVTVTVLYADRGTLRPVTTYTQIAERIPVVNQIEVRANGTALALNGSGQTDGSISLSAGVLNLAGALTHTSSADAALAATSAGLATGERATGATATLSAPPASAAVGPIPAGSGGLAAGCLVVCWDASRVEVGAITSDAGLPNVGAAGAPMQALLTDATQGGFTFHNGDAGNYRGFLSLSGSLARLSSKATASPAGVDVQCDVPGIGTGAFVSAGGFIRTTATGAATSAGVVEACAVTRASRISLFPTTFAPDGVIVVELEKSAAQCTVAGAAHAATVDADYRAVVKYFNPNAPATYRTAAVIEPGLTDDPLVDIPLTTPVRLEDESTPAIEARVLGDYIDSWSALTSRELVPTAIPGFASVSVPGVFRLTSRALRTGIEPLPAVPGTPVETTETASPTASPTVDPSDSAEPTPPVTTEPPAPELVDLSSAVTATFGEVGCTAEDSR